jgi:hypothetical protein
MSERDAMVCRSCGKEERASEGYPCDSCGTFICQICAMRGVTLCKKCAADAGGDSADGTGDQPPPAA